MRVIRLGWYAVVISIAWIGWLIVFLPTQSRPAAMTCAQLSSLAHVDAGSFASECQRLVTNSPGDVEVYLLLATCILLLAVSVGLLLRERSLLGSKLKS